MRNHEIGLSSDIAWKSLEVGTRWKAQLMARTRLATERAVMRYRRVHDVEMSCSS